MEIITRTQYMVGEVDHETYYSQFVTYGVLQLVRTIEQDILSSKDPHFNDIPLKRWERLAAGLPSDAVHMHKLADRSGISQCDRVCILKAAARRIRKEATSC